MAISLPSKSSKGKGSKVSSTAADVFDGRRWVGDVIEGKRQLAVSKTDAGERVVILSVAGGGKQGSRGSRVLVSSLPALAERLMTYQPGQADKVSGGSGSAARTFNATVGYTEHDGVDSIFPPGYNLSFTVGNAHVNDQGVLCPGARGRGQRFCNIYLGAAVRDDAGEVTGFDQIEPVDALSAILAGLKQAQARAVSVGLL